MKRELTLPLPDDFHQHLREGDAMRLPLAHAARQFGRVMAMPNLRQPIQSSAALDAYLKSAQQYLGSESRLRVYGTMYLGDTINAHDLEQAHTTMPLLAVKWYPRGVTTNSGRGVEAISSCYHLLELMQDLDIVLSIHGEVNDPKVDIFDREKVFIEQVLEPLLDQFPRLRIVLEHITSRAAVACLHRHGGERLAATITAHHLLVNRHDLLAGGIKPHLYCLPIAKREQDRIALVEAATSGKPYFFLGSDSAPHAKTEKESACGCAGCYTGGQAMELYAEAFARVDALDRLPHFASRFGAEFYRLPLAQNTITLTYGKHTIPDSYGEVVPFWANQSLSWRVA